MAAQGSQIKRHRPSYQLWGTISPVEDAIDLGWWWPPDGPGTWPDPPAVAAGARMSVPVGQTSDWTESDPDEGWAAPYPRRRRRPGRRAARPRRPAPAPKPYVSPEPVPIVDVSAIEAARLHEYNVPEIVEVSLFGQWCRARAERLVVAHEVRFAVRVLAPVTHAYFDPRTPVHVSVAAEGVTWRRCDDSG